MNVIVWDLETVPDLRAYAATHDMLAATDEQLWEAVGDKFPKAPLNSIVCIGALVASDDSGAWRVEAIGAPHVAERSERDLIQAFVDKIAALRPLLVTFNGHTFDLPVLRYRAMLNKVYAPGLAVGGYFARYNTDHLDLCDVLASFSFPDKQKLDFLSRTMGLPGNAGKIDGSQVAQHYREGKIQEIADHCSADLQNTYRLFLRYELFRGRLTPDKFEESEENLAAFLAGKREPAPEEEVQKLDDAIPGFEHA